MRSLLAALSIAVVLVNAGCRPAVTKSPEAAPVAQAEPKKEPPKKDPPKIEAPPEQFKKPPIRGGSIVRRVDVADVMYLMKNLNLATINFQNERNRFPNSREELEPYYEKNAKITLAFTEGDLVYIWKARKSEDSGKSILAYEGQGDTLGRRVVLLMDGEIKEVSDDEFKAMPKAMAK